VAWKPYATKKTPDETGWQHFFYHEIHEKTWGGLAPTPSLFVLFVVKNRFLAACKFAKMGFRDYVCFKRFQRK
jgi:hypothetical protein